MSHERSAFQTAYPQAAIAMGTGTSRAAVQALFAADCDLAVITRELRPEERRAAQLGKLDLDGYRFARNAVLLVVHPTNPLQNISLDDLRRVYRGDATSWSEIGGGVGPLRPISQPSTADITEFFDETALGGEPMRARVVPARDDSEVVAIVARDPAAIGYVSLGSPVDRVRVLNVANLRGLPYWKPDPEAIYKGDYPLTRFYTMYARSTAPRVTNGFITYVTSIDGQRIVHEAGLVPTSVPVRFVRRSPMVSSHSDAGIHTRGDSIPRP